MSAQKKKELMYRKLVGLTIDRSTIAAQDWASMSAEDVLKMRHLPMRLRQLIVQYKNTGVSLDSEEIQKEIKIIQEESTKTTDITENTDLTKYDPKQEIKEILDEYVAKDVPPSLYTEEELRSFFTSDMKATTLKAVISNAKGSIPDIEKVDMLLLNNIAKEYVLKKGTK